MTPNPKDPQAELDKLIDTALHPERNGLLIKEQIAEGADHEWLVKRELKKAFQAHQQELLSELLGELPEKELPEVKPGAMIIEHEGKLVKTEHLAKMRNTGFNQAIDQVVEILTSKIGELNG